MTDAKKNLAASVHQKLQNKGREENLLFNDLLQHYGLERFLYRLANSKHKDKFILKGALMFTVWDVPDFRTTRDIDLLGIGPNDTETLLKVFQEICQTDTEPDGLTFDPKTVAAEAITQQATYMGARITFRGNLGNAQIPMQVDIGFGDKVEPKPKKTKLPTLLDFPAPVLRAYPKEAVVAEKFEAMVRHALANSRMKDIHDLWVLAQTFEFDGALLAKSIKAVFDSRGTMLPEKPMVLSAEFSDDQTKKTQWQTFHKKARGGNAPADLAKAIKAIEKFLGPLANNLALKKAFKGTWQPGGPWQPK